MHEQRTAIDAELRKGRKYADIQKKFRLRGVSVHSLSRHKKNHLVEKGSIAAAPTQQAFLDNEALFAVPSDAAENCVLELAGMAALSREFAMLAQKALRSGRQRDAIAALTQVRACHEAMAQYKAKQAIGSEHLKQPIFYIQYRAPKGPDLATAIAEARAKTPEWDALRAKFELLHTNATFEEWRKIEFLQRMDEILNKLEPRTRALFLQDFVRTLCERELSALMAVVYRGMANELRELVPYDEVRGEAEPVDLEAERLHDERVAAERQEAADAEQAELAEERRRRSEPKGLDAWKKLGGGR